MGRHKPENFNDTQTFQYDSRSAGTRSLSKQQFLDGPSFLCVLVDVCLAWQDHLVLLASQFLVVMMCPAFRLFNIRITFFSE